MESFSTTFFCPTYSSNVGGRRLRLNSSSFEIRSGETSRSRGIGPVRASSKQRVANREWGIISFALALFAISLLAALLLLLKHPAQKLLQGFQVLVPGEDVR